MRESHSRMFRAATGRVLLTGLVTLGWIGPAAAQAPAYVQVLATPEARVGMCSTMPAGTWGIGAVTRDHLASRHVVIPGYSAFSVRREVTLFQDSLGRLRAYGDWAMRADPDSVVGDLVRATVDSAGRVTGDRVHVGRAAPRGAGAPGDSAWLQGAMRSLLDAAIASRNGAPLDRGAQAAILRVADWVRGRCPEVSGRRASGDVVPSIDLTKKVTNEEDFSGRGVVGGVAKGVAGGGATGVPGDDGSWTYFEFQVEKPVTQVPGSPTPHYPDSLRLAHVEGEVLAQFVVDTTGKAVPGTFKVLKASREPFIRAVIDALPQMRFVPAEVGGRKVKQLVQMPFHFNVTR